MDGEEWRQAAGLLKGTQRRTYKTPHVAQSLDCPVSTGAFLYLKKKPRRYATKPGL